MTSILDEKNLPFGLMKDEVSPIAAERANDNSAIARAVAAKNTSVLPVAPIPSVPVPTVPIPSVPVPTVPIPSVPVPTLPTPALISIPVPELPSVAQMQQETASMLQKIHYFMSHTSVLNISLWVWLIIAVVITVLIIMHNNNKLEPLLNEKTLNVAGWLWILTIVLIIALINKKLTENPKSEKFGSTDKYKIVYYKNSSTDAKWKDVKTQLSAYIALSGRSNIEIQEQSLLTGIIIFKNNIQVKTITRADFNNTATNIFNIIRSTSLI
jgi:hypothetical protein